MQKPHQNSGCQKHNMKQVPYWIPTNISYHSKKFRQPSTCHLCNPALKSSEKAFQCGNIMTAHKWTGALRCPPLQKFQENVCCWKFWTLWYTRTCYWHTEYCTEKHHFSQEMGYGNISLPGNKQVHNSTFICHRLHFYDSSTHLRSSWINYTFQVNHNAVYTT